MPDAAAMMASWQNSPVTFSKQAFLNSDPLTPQQIDLLTAVAGNKRVSAKSGRGLGKTRSVAILTWWMLCCYPHSVVAASAPTGHQLADNVWQEIKKLHNNLHPWLRKQFTVTSERVYHKDHPQTWYCVGRTARKEAPDALQGFHNTYLLIIIDEASGVPDEIFETIEGSLTGDNNRILLTGNPVRSQGFFVDTFRKYKHQWCNLTLNSEDSPLVSKEFISSWLDKCGGDREHDLYKAHVRGEIPSASVNQFISQSLIDAALLRSYSDTAFDFAPKILGVDVARYGDDASVIVRRQGLMAWKSKQYRGLDTMSLVRQIISEIREYNPDAVFVDGIGVGAGVCDRLRELGFDIIEVNSGESSGKPDYLNLRAEMWANCREWLKTAQLPVDDTDMAEQLAIPEYLYTMTGKLQIESKDDIKKRGYGSPDVADALIHTFAFPVAKKTDYQDESRNQSNVYKTVYSEHRKPISYRRTTQWAL
jgi:hypothetical protein